MCKVDKHEAEVERHHEAGTCGPLNHTLQHWHKPRAAQSKMGQKRWVFTCRYCKAQRLVKCTANAATFQDKYPKPTIGNLSTHLRTDHPDKNGDTDDSNKTTNATVEGDSGNMTWARGLKLHGSRQLMDKFLADGLDNPQIEPTQDGFQTMLALWVFDDDLPFTMGELGASGGSFSISRVNSPCPLTR